MAEIYDFDEAYQERLYKSNEWYINAISQIDPSDPDCTEKLQMLSSYHDKLLHDYKNYGDLLNDNERLRVDEENNIAEAENSEKRNFVELLKIGATAVLTIGSGLFGLYKFNRSSAKEEDGAYLTMTDKSTVSDGLRDKSDRFLNWLK